MNILEIKDLVKRYGDFTAVNHFNLTIKEGEILGLLGPNGSGKSTTINCLLSLLKYEYGSVEIFERPMGPNEYKIKQEIGVVPQDLAFFKELTVTENVDFFCGLYINDRDKRQQYVKDALEFVGLENFKKHYPDELSGGLKRRLNIACGIAHRPKFIIFDEPTVAVDPQSRNKILEGIKTLNKEGSTILYTSHYMEEIELICSRIVIMDNGQEMAQGTKESLKQLSKYGEIIVFESYNLTDAFVEEIAALSFVQDIEREETILSVKCSAANQNLIHLIQLFQERNIEYVSVRNELPTLNDIFLEITGKGLRD